MASVPTSEQTAELLGRLLVSKGHTLATAESCTGGMIGAVLTAIPGSSHWFKGGIIAYDNTIKHSLLDVSEKVLEEYGAVSTQTASDMARGVKKKMNTTCSIAVTGIAGPDGGSNEKPVGLVHLCASCQNVYKTVTEVFPGDRRQVREQTVLKALECLMSLVSND